MKKKLSGIVVKKSGDKTIKVCVNIPVVNKIYKKTLINKYYYQVHDSKNEYKVGDSVKFVFCRKISATKSSYTIK